MQVEEGVTNVPVAPTEARAVNRESRPESARGRVRCPECHERKSKISLLSLDAVRMIEPGYVDSDGKLHRHGLNTAMGVFLCSNGHTFRAQTLPPCPACGEWWRDLKEEAEEDRLEKEREKKREAVAKARAAEAKAKKEAKAEAKKKARAAAGKGEGIEVKPRRKKQGAR